MISSILKYSISTNDIIEIFVELELLHYFRSLLTLFSIKKKILNLKI